MNPSNHSSALGPLPTLLITVKSRGNARTQIWDHAAPLALGHPLRWALERRPEGLRLRDLASSFDRVETGRTRDISERDWGSGGFEMELSAGYRLKIEPARRIAPVIESSDPAAAAQGEGALRIYRYAGQWVFESRDLDRGYIARYQRKPLFELCPVSSGFGLEILAAGLRLSDSSGASRAVEPGQKLELTPQGLIETRLAFLPADSVSIQSWRFGLTRTPSFVDRRAAPALTPAGIPGVTPALDDTAFFRQALRAAGLAFALLIAASWLWPRTHEDSHELVPTQFTRIVMAPQPKSHAQASASSESSAPSAAKLPPKVQNSAVVQAFRAQALNHAMSGLLKGGMSRLLAQSDFVAGTARSTEAKNLFNSKSAELQTTEALRGAGAHPGAVQVAALGGDGSGAGQPGLGYGKGQHAGVKGQGKGFVPFVSADASGSIVDDGLTKDEVGEVIHRHLSEVRYCYESAMIRSPDIEGKLITNFTINGQGMVKSTEVKSSTLPDPRLDDCILRRLATWPFPKPRGGVDVAVSYPFIFKTLGR